CRALVGACGRKLSFVVSTLADGVIANGWVMGAD
ncbi:MAG: hypothetical protein ACI8UP_004022, partial [Porticoccaceae bacterium]